MAGIDEMLHKMNNTAAEEIFQFRMDLQERVSWIKNFGEEIRNKMLEFETNSNKSVIPRTGNNKCSSSKRLAETSSSDDDALVNMKVRLHDTIDTENSAASTGRLRRGAAKAAELKISETAHLKLNSKMRRPTNENEKSQQIVVKIEKKSQSMLVKTDAVAQNINKPKVLTDVTNENMPPPTTKPKRVRKKIKKEPDVTNSTDDEAASVPSIRVTRSKKTNSKQPELEQKSVATVRKPSKSSRRREDSDVLFQEFSVPVVLVIDSDSETDLHCQIKPVATITTPETTQIKEKSTTKNKKPSAENEKPMENEAASTDNETASNPSREKTDTEDEEVVKSKKGKNKKRINKMELKLKTNIKKEKESIEDTEPSSVNNDTQESIYEDAVSEDKEKITVSEKTNEEADKGELLKPKVSVSRETRVVSCKQPVIAVNDTRVIQKEVTSTTSSLDVENEAQTRQQEHSAEIGKIIKETGVQTNCTVQLQLPSVNATFGTNQQNANNKTYDPNTTHVLSPKQVTSRWQQSKNMPTPSHLLTDDDDSIEVPIAQLPNKTPAKQTVKIKSVFSPYGFSPVKKRVAAFEKLGSEDMPSRVTRTKTRNLAAVTKKEQESTKLSNNAPPAAKVKSKYFTPSKYTDGKQYNKLNKNASVMSSDISLKSATSVKPTRTELQERREEEQKRKLVHEDVVKRKKEALLQAKTEEQKRKREEKQLKAQKVREAKEREKEEKIRKMIQEKEEKSQYEEKLKREWIAKKAADEEKRKKAEEQLIKLKQDKLKQQLEDYEKRQRMLNQKPPPLPTEAMEDSEDEGKNEAKQKYMKPFWAQSTILNQTLIAQSLIPNKFIEQLFQMQAQTPDLREIFESVDERLLRRNSSAVWRTPPRYSTLPKI